MSGQRFPASHRVRSKKDFDRAFRLRASAADEHVVAFAAGNGLGYVRLGLSVPRRIGTAVRRNRWKRLLREAFRLARDSLPPGVDLILVPRGEAPPPLAALVQSLPRVARRAARKAAAAP